MMMRCDYRQKVFMNVLNLLLWRFLFWIFKDFFNLKILLMIFHIKVARFIIIIASTNNPSRSKVLLSSLWVKAHIHPLFIINVCEGMLRVIIVTLSLTRLILKHITCISITLVIRFELLLSLQLLIRMAILKCSHFPIHFRVREEKSFLPFLFFNNKSLCWRR
jgi:hypothetical protein